MAKAAADQQVHSMNVEMARAQLVQLLGHYAPDCYAGPVFEDFESLLRLMDLTPHPAAQQAQETNSGVRAAELALEIARLEVQKQNAMHAPPWMSSPLAASISRTRPGAFPGSPGTEALSVQWAFS